MPKIRVDMDRPFIFDIDTMDIVKNVHKEFFEMQEFLEHAFRYQTGLSPLKNSPFDMKKMGEKLS